MGLDASRPLRIEESAPWPDAIDTARRMQDNTGYTNRSEERAMSQRDRSGRAAAAAAGAALVALLLAVPLQAAQPPQEVKVINTPAEAVPVAVQGTPSVTVLGTTSVAVQGTPSVTVQGTPSVTVGNTLSQPVPTRSVDNPARQPVQRTGLVIIGTADQIEEQTLYTVPAGKRLVIEEASVRAQLFAGVSQAMVFLRSNGGGFGGHYVPLTSVGALDGFGTVLVGTELLRGYADAGTAVDVSVTINTASGSGGRFEITLTGHLVDL